jgi:hypothetical protein
MTIYQTLLSRGYFPKELPPAFFTLNFANYAVSTAGRAKLTAYKPVSNFTQCVEFRLALPGSEKRQLHIPHPFSFAVLAGLTAKHFSRLLRKAGRSKFSRSRPIYSASRTRALRPRVAPSSLAQERATIRAGSRFVVKADVNQFYPSLYTHAVGWAIDPKLRKKINWTNTKLVGKKFDQALMNMQGKISQGIGIGHDVSFLLGEIVLAEVDRSLSLAPDKCYRWYDDYEIACDTAEEADRVIDQLSRALQNFNLRLNWRKTRAEKLPAQSQDEWQHELASESGRRFKSANDMVEFFDAAFRLHKKQPDAPVLLYALGLLFKVSHPSEWVARVGQSCVTQALIGEPGCAQKAFALLSFWALNGVPLDHALLRRSVEQLVLRHSGIDFSSDVAWSLAFCIERQIQLGKKAAKTLSILTDDCIAIQALHAHADGLLPQGFSKIAIAKGIANEDLEGEHWLLAYEAARHGFLPGPVGIVKANPLFADFLARGVTFYRRQMPPYATILHPGGAPEWVVMAWLRRLRSSQPFAGEPLPGAVEAVRQDLKAVEAGERTLEELVAELLNVHEPAPLQFAGYEPYSF